MNSCPAWRSNSKQPSARPPFPPFREEGAVYPPAMPASLVFPDHLVQRDGPTMCKHAKKVVVCVLRSIAAVQTARDRRRSLHYYLVNGYPAAGSEPGVGSGCKNRE